MTDAISIEETNQIRAAIGLKPLPVPGKPEGPRFRDSKSSTGKGQDDNGDDESRLGSTLESRQGAAYDNWKKLQDEAAAKAARGAKTEAIKKARDAARRFAKLEGRGLGDADGDDEDLDTRAWILKQDKRRKKIEKARKLEQELAEREQAAEYTSKDLAGLKVAHEVDAFDEGDEQVLVLKDATIGENEAEGDELENPDRREREKLNERLELKKKARVYDPNADDGSEEKSILKQYDEEIDGKRKKTFTLSGQASSSSESKNVAKADGRQNIAISLEIPAVEPGSDYLDLSEIKIRKPKKRKTKSTKQKIIDDDDIFPIVDPFKDPNGHSIKVDNSPEHVSNRVSKRTFEETSLMDDEDLQAALTVQRRNALKKRKKTGPAELAKKLREEASVTPLADGDMGVEDDVGLVIDETSEFVANLQKPTAPLSQSHALQPPNSITATTSMAHSPPDVGEDHDGDVEMSRPCDGSPEETKSDHLHESQPAVTSTGLDEEITLDAGIGSTLTMLTQRGLLKPSATGDLNELHRERQRFLSEKQRREAEAEHRARLQRERDRASGKLDRMSAREKEAYAQAENKHRDQYESRQMAEIFNREYKPDIEITYTDEFGRHMNQKEAFKHLSHQFHGKGSGKQKTEKRLKKIAEEKKREAKSALSGAAGENGKIGGALGAVSKTSKTPGIRLQ